MKKNETYQYVVTTPAATETRTTKRKDWAISRCKAAIVAAEIESTGVVYFQNEKEQLTAIIKFSKQPDESILEEKFKR